MRVLIAYATKHGATEGIAARIGDGLASAGHDPDVRDAGDVADLAGYDAFVLGSAAYIGHWRKEAIELARRLEQERGERPVWLFSSGPLGEDPTSLTLPEKAMRKLPAGKALLPEGDFRDWDDIDAWAASIAADLGSRQAT
jgi:menaquinone-dependent protoporphyrinogen oxidase